MSTITTTPTTLIRDDEEALTPTITEAELVRITGLDGTPPATARHMAGLTVQDALTIAKVELPSGHSVVQNGRPAQLSDTVEAGTTLVIAPRINNG